MNALPPFAQYQHLTRTDTRPHAVVIGSGFGGLAAAIRLGARGYRVTVLERLAAPGGRASVFRQDGFTFDAGPTIITAPFLLEELWALAVLPHPFPGWRDVRLFRRRRGDARTGAKTGPGRPRRL
jgi:phytoene dehydrogenase-like protein